MAHTGYKFVPPNNPGDYPPKMGTAQEQPLRTKRFRKIKHCSEYATPWTEQLKRISSEHCNKFPVPTGGPVDGVRTCDRTTNDSTYL